MQKVRFKRGFSLNGTWYEKNKVETFDTQTADALKDKGVVTFVTEDVKPNKEEGK